MKKFMLLIAGIGVAAAAVPASAAPTFQGGWQNINARQDRIEQRINQGIRSGSLSRREATRIRNEYRGLVRLEARYRASRPGLTQGERRDLDRRYDMLSAKIRFEKHDGNRHRR